MADHLLITEALVRDTFREAMARKIFWGLFALSTLMIAFFLFLLRIDIVEGATASITLLGQGDGRSVDVDTFVRRAHAGIAAFLYTWGMFLSVFASAGLTPSLLEPGRIELLLSKPVGRAHLLLGRYLGNLLVVSLNVTYLVVGVWLIFGYKTGVWNPAFLSAIASTIFTFAVLLCVVVLIGVLFESTALAVMVTAGLMLMSPLLAQGKIVYRLLSSEWSREVWNVLYQIVPKVYDLGKMTLDYITSGRVESLTPAITSGLFGVAALSAAAWFFSRRDF